MTREWILPVLVKYIVRWEVVREYTWQFCKFGNGIWGTTGKDKGKNDYARRMAAGTVICRAGKASPMSPSVKQDRPLDCT